MDVATLLRSHEQYCNPDCRLSTRVIHSEELSTAQRSTSFRFISSYRVYLNKISDFMPCNATERVQRCDKTGVELRLDGCSIATKRVEPLGPPMTRCDKTGASIHCDETGANTAVQGTRFAISRPVRTLKCDSAA